MVEFIDRNIIASLNIEALPEPPLDLAARLSLLIEHFRQHRCLIILDDVDRLFSSGELAGNYIDIYSDSHAGRLRQRIFKYLSIRCR